MYIALFDKVVIVLICNNRLLILYQHPELGFVCRVGTLLCIDQIRLIRLFLAFAIAKAQT